MAYVRAFEKKHEMYFDYFVLDNVLSFAMFGDYYINISDVVLDIDRNVPEKIFIKWYDITLDLAMRDKPTINYATYLNNYKL